MASIFTFDPSPPSVSSPWSTPRTSTPRLISKANSSSDLHSNDVQIETHLHDGGDGVIVTSLEAEPQEGPTEYKLHLLCRTRRSFNYTSRDGHVSGSRLPPSIKELRLEEAMKVPNQGVSMQSSSLTRQNRINQLTTQLLWRLQQSISYHSTGIRPQPRQEEAGVLSTHPKAFPGLEESKGALYEIGVADDGEFIGLAEDELEESLETLRTMAASIGCSVSVLRKVAIGECQWLEPEPDGLTVKPKNSLLWVAEAYVRPDMGSRAREHSLTEHDEPTSDGSSSSRLVDQLRVTLTGATMSGKTSLLGTLTTDTLDNGRGKSRLNLLKHQHEIASGMTSSVTHELLGYCKAEQDGHDYQVINFAHGNISSWVDIHSSCHDGRLVFFSDSAGHPRYRRTTVRGLVGWDPHWTMLCIPADTLEDTSGRFGSTPPTHETLGLPAADVDLSQEHLDLCLKLHLPLVVVITKTDLASRTGLRAYLNIILSSLKRHGRQPIILTEYGKAYAESGMSRISGDDLADVSSHLSGLREDPIGYVPIVFSSAVKGMGIKTLHTLLHELPVPACASAPPEAVSHPGIFDIEDTFTGPPQAGSNAQTIILSGAVRQGQICVGDELLVGPFMMESAIPTNRRRQSSAQRGSLSPFRSLSGTSPDMATLSSAAGVDKEWYKVRVCSVRFLRLPARAILADQVGTAAVVPVDEAAGKALLKGVRKGMILTEDANARASKTFRASFLRSDVDPLSIGSSVVVYFNSVRANAKIIAGAIESVDTVACKEEDSDSDRLLEMGFEDDNGMQRRGRSREKEEKLLVTFQFLASREFVENGSRMLVMPGGGAGVYGGGSRGAKGVAGLDGFVGRVVKV